MEPYLHPRDAIMQTMERIYRYRMTTTSGGNISILDSDHNIWITPARVDKGALTRDDIVSVDPEWNVQGRHNPSSEFPFHRAIYSVREDIRAVVHAHPVALVAFSICGKTPDTRIFHQAHSVCGQTGFAPYALPGSQDLGNRIAEAFASGCESVILENHGVVVGGRDLAQAFQRFEAFEFAAKTLVKARQLGKIHNLTENELQQARDRGTPLGSFTPTAPKPAELELRRELVRFIHRGCRQRLLISTEGSFSARLGEDDFLITPTREDRELLRAGDLVRVENGNAESGKEASRASTAHRAIYQRHPHVQSIAFAHPVNATAFSVTDAPFDARTIPESYVFLRDVERVPYGIQYLADGSLADHISEASPAAILANDGVVVTGTSVLDTFDRLEVLESTAEAIINARAIGEVAAMPERVIQELRVAFKLPS
jgi:L-fuculose-phosphate aldolase